MPKKSSYRPRKADGTLDRRYAVNRTYGRNKDGSLDLRCTNYYGFSTDSTSTYSRTPDLSEIDTPVFSETRSTSRSITTNTTTPDLEESKSPKIKAETISQSDKNVEIPNEFLCPITHELMENPVIASDGHSYEEIAIKRWLQIGSQKSPITREFITSTFIPNLTLKKAILNFKETLPQIQREKQIKTELDETIKNLTRLLQEKDHQLTLILEENRRLEHEIEETKLSKGPLAQIKPYTVLIGNPGVGKSTLLNAMLGKIAFKAGFSLGKGLTKILQEELDQNGNSFIDTPGLSDPFMKEEAAKEIKKALTKGGEFKIIFVATLESGRIRPEDQTTMKLVLEAAPMIGQKYSLLINKASKGTLKDWENEEKRGDFLAILNSGLPSKQNLPGPHHIFLNPFDRSLEDESDILVPLSSDLQQFLEMAPTLEIIRSDVRDLQIQDFDKFKYEISKNVSDKRAEIENKRLA